ncbi:porin [Paraburkholderia sp. BL23I1N1]|uniref:porin n=1 Tax=Paraburkholderia sp. BL23I1N1 TaxID=1938802 RepID=UPI000E7544CA|nr:porin [Paraburkholderia sp. BL23I1N1]
MVLSLSAHASGGVTLYGILDNSVEVANVGSGTAVRMDSGEVLGSRFGFLGTEDIGGGYSIKFTLEQGFLVNNGAVSTPSLSFSRQAWVGVAGPWGELRFGRQNSPVYIPVSGLLDAFGGATIGSALISFLSIVPRVNNAISYHTPNIAGLTAQFMVGLRDTTTAPQNGIANYHVGIEYANGPVGATFGYQSVNDPVGISYPSAPPGSTLKALYAGVSYSFGPVTAFIGYNNNRQTETPLNRDVYVASLRYTISPDMTAAIGIGHARDKSSLDNNANQIGVSYNYFLSKRTTLYAAAAWIDNQNKATFAMNGATTAGIPVAYPGATAKGMQIGLVHRF